MLQLSIEKETLYYEQHAKHETQWVPQSSISLEKLLENLFHSHDHMDERQKTVLSWLLAKAVWQYYDSPWMVHPWTKRNVHFLPELRKDPYGNKKYNDGIYVNEPLLSISISPSTPNGEQASPPRHRIPKVFELGMMLIEIQLGYPIENLYADQAWLQHSNCGKPHSNTNLFICRDLIKESWFSCHLQDHLEDLINQCINPDKTFYPHVGDHHDHDTEGIRGALIGLVTGLEAHVIYNKPKMVKPLNFPKSSVPGTSSVPRQHQSKRPSSQISEDDSACRPKKKRRNSRAGGQTMAHT